LATQEPGVLEDAAPPGRLPRIRGLLGSHPRRTLLLLGLGVASLLVYESVRQTEPFQMIDMVVYRDEGQPVRPGQNPQTEIFSPRNL